MQLKAILYTTSTKNSYAMHTVKLLLTYYLNISEQAANIYQIAESNRIESKLFLPELECSTTQYAQCRCSTGSCPIGEAVTLLLRRCIETAALARSLARRRRRCCRCLPRFQQLSLSAVPTDRRSRRRRRLTGAR